MLLYRYFIKISFDGTHYNGWQIQKNSSQTVQQKINDGLSRLLNENICVHGCCRTDAGVHALELVAHFDSKKKFALSQMENRLYQFNSQLPSDISILRLMPVHPDADARFDAISRTYQYCIHQFRNPFLLNRSYYCHYELDFDILQKTAALLKRYDDFSAFSKIHTQVKTKKCKIFSAKWSRISAPYTGGVKGVLVFTIRADRFLRGMVRMLVGTMLLAGRKKISVSDFKKIMESKDCRNAGALAPACGLYLTKVEYPEKIFQCRT